MNAEPRAIRRHPAKRPVARTVSVTIEDGDFAGWSATARADFPARLVVDLNSGDIAKILAVLEVVIVEHNMPNADDEVAEHLLDVDPYSGLLAVANALGAELGKLPNR